MSTTTVPRKKRGTPGAFQGKRLEFMTSQLDTYMEKSQVKKTREFWPLFFHTYWRKFPWRLPLNEDPPDTEEGETEPEEPEGNADAPDGEDDKTDDEGENERERERELEAGPKEELTAEEKEQKKKIMKATNTVGARCFLARHAPRDALVMVSYGWLMCCLQKIKTWFNHQRTAVGLAGIPWQPFLAALRRLPGPAPKRLTDAQWYMQHEDFKPKLAAVIAERYAQEPAKEHLRLCCPLAQTLLNEEDEAVKKRIKKEAEVEYKQALKAHKEAAEGLPSASGQDQALCCQRFSSLLSSLLVSFVEYTGYHLTLLAGRVDPGTGVEVLGVHTGKTKGPKGEGFATHDPEGYKVAIGQFTRFIWAARKSRALRGGTGNGGGLPCVRHGGHGQAHPPPPPPGTIPVASAMDVPTTTPASATSTFDTQSTALLVAEATPVTPIHPCDVPLPPLMDDDEDIMSGCVGGAVPPGRGQQSDKEGGWGDDEEEPYFDFGGKDALVLSLLREQLKRADTKEQARLLGEIRRGVPYELTRLNNIAKHKRTLRMLSLNKSADELFGDLKGKKQKAPTKTKGRVKKVKQGMQSEEKRRTRAKPVPRAKAAPKSDSTWATSVWGVLEEKEYGPEWTELVHVWFEREEGKGFKSSLKALNTTERPEEVKGWVGRGRKATWRPNINNIEDFVARVWKWWVHINPAWRKGAFMLREPKAPNNPKFHL
ncbi:hypothetical protein C8R44DRAFT_888138 [Mycena epipterygia]|nr:hypothetical protein C8R44DRAFT_888138 [Mycena epipterygia]